MTDAQINAFVGGVVGGFAAVTVTTIALQALQVYQQRESPAWMQSGFAGAGSDWS